jgi:hypothetical protein
VKPIIDNRVTLEGRFACVRIQAAIVTDQLRLLSRLNEEEDDASKFYQSPDKSVKVLLKDCESFVKESSASSLPRLAIRGSLIYASIAKSLQSSRRSGVEPTQKVADYIATAKSQLDSAKELCNSPFDGAEQLRKDIEAAQRVLGREWYEPVTAEELEAVKGAMVSGPGGIFTHSGHWYKCQNGHTVSILSFQGTKEHTDMIADSLCLVRDW